MKKVIRVETKIIDWDTGEVIKDGNIYFFAKEHSLWNVTENWLTIRKEVKRLLKSL